MHEWGELVGRSSTVKACYASCFQLSGGRFYRPSLTLTMFYRVLSLTMAQVRQGALGFQRELSAVLSEHPEIKVYSVSPFDLDERRRFKDRFGGDIVYFFNDAAWQEGDRMGLDLRFVGKVSEEELPRRRSVVVGKPERAGDIGTSSNREIG
jgi:hypothetical protein